MSEKSVLIVDDEQDLAEAISDMFEVFDYTVETAGNGLEALEKFAKQDYSILITDIRMPKMDGRELIMTIRKHDQETPIICMSGYSDYTKDEIMDWGANRFFAKPGSVQYLVEMSDELIRSHSE